MKTIQELKEGDNISQVFLCKNKQSLRTRAGKTYYSLQLQDKTGQLDGKIWDLSSGIDYFESMDYIHVEGQVVVFQNAPQLNVYRVRMAQKGEYDPADFVPTTEKNIADMKVLLGKYVASVKESIGSLNHAIDYYLSENVPSRKYGYLRDVKRMLRNIALTTLRNVIDLKRNIDNTYKNEPTFAVKKKKLVHLDEKRQDIAALINECERVIDEKQTTFFMVAMDAQLKDIVTDVKLQLREVYHNLLELDRQIISYLNLINALFCEVNPIPVKKAVELLGLCGGTLRMPLTEMEPQNVERLKKAMIDYGVLKA